MLTPKNVRIAIKMARVLLNIRRSSPRGNYYLHPPYSTLLLYNLALQGLSLVSTGPQNGAHFNEEED